MNRYLIILLITSLSWELFAAEASPKIRKKPELYSQLDNRLTELEKRLILDIETMHKNQAILSQEMIRLNDRLESRFDTYFLWGYGTLLVVISTLMSVIFSKQKAVNLKKENKLIDEDSIKV